MKKALLIICFLASASVMFAQTQATMSLSETLVTGVAEDIEVGVTIDYMDPGTTIVGVQLSILYDETLLSWNGTMGDPVPGVTYIDPGFTPVTPLGNYLWNTNFTGNLIMTFIDPTWLGFPVANGNDLIRYSFHYNGGLPENGMSPITFSLTAKLSNGGYIKIINELTDQNFTAMEFVDNPLGGGCGVGLCDGMIYRSGPTANMWTGNVDNDWFNPGNWSDNAVPTTEDVVIDVTTSKAPPVVFGGSATTGALTIMPGAALAIDVTGDLTTLGLFTCDGDFELFTDAGGFSGSFVDMGGLAGTGMFHMDRIVTCDATPGNPYDPADPFGWHYVSAPIDGLSTDGLQDFYVNQWDETTGMFMNYAGMEPCVPFAGSETLDGMEVWSLKYDELWPTYGCPQPVNGPVLMYSGPFATLHTGAMSSPATFSAGAFAGWNMHANPYPSGLVMDAIVWDANAIPGGAFYDCPGGYLYWTPALGAYTAPVGNGFFTEYVAAGSFDLAGTERGTPSDWFYKDEVTSLLIVEATGDETSDLTYVRFMDNAQAGFAPDGDFHKLFSNAQGLAEIYTTAGADQLAVNALPATDMVPMGFTSATSGSYTLQAIETSEFTEVYLEDLVTGEMTNLLTGSYTFDYTVGDDADRFMLHFGPVGIGENLMNGVSIWSTDNNIYVSVPKELKGTIAVYNMMGQEVVSTDTQPGTNVIPMENTNTYYVVKVLSNENAVTGKVYIK